MENSKLKVPESSRKSELEFRSVVYATDFAACSQNAGLFAARLAAHFSARLFVVHSFFLSQAAMEVEAGHKTQSQQRRDLEFLLEKEAYLLAHSSSVEATPALLDGAPHTTIPEFAETNAPALVVMGTVGRNRAERSLIGSVAEGILRSTRCPSLVVGPKVPSAVSTGFPFRRILYATDLTPAGASAAPLAISLAQTFAAEIDILNVIAASDVEHPDRLSEIRQNFFDVLDRLVPQQAREFCDPRTFVEIGNAHRQILTHIKERSIDLLVLGIEKTSHLGLTKRTSGAFQLIVEAPCPVLTLVA